MRELYGRLLGAYLLSYYPDPEMPWMYTNAE